MGYAFCAALSHITHVKYLAINLLNKQLKLITKKKLLSTLIKLPSVKLVQYNYGKYIHYYHTIFYLTKDLPIEYLDTIESIIP